jgi:hypothetical protein
MIRVNLNPKKKGTAVATIGVVSAGLLVVCGIMVGWFGGTASFTSRATVGEYFTGYKPNPVEQEKFIGSLGRFKSLSTGAPDLFTDALPNQALLWKAIYVASEKSGRGKYRIINQEIGDCVSHGWARGIEGAMAVDYLDGKLTDWWSVSPESVYAGRMDTGDASWSDGWHGAAAAKATSKLTGVLWKQKYQIDGNVLDLTKYDGTNRAKNFGARGLPAWIKQEAKKHLVREVALITSTAEAKAAHANGYFIPVCSNLGFSPTVRNADGVVRQAGSWSHCMCSCGYYTLSNGETVFVIFNSWGEGSSSGPGGPHDIPTGAFAIRERDMQRILSQRDSYAVSGAYGFERRDLDHETWAANVFSDRLSEESEFHFAVAP